MAGLGAEGASGSQAHFNDLCRLLGELTPDEADPSGETYCDPEFFDWIWRWVVRGEGD